MSEIKGANFLEGHYRRAMLAGEDHQMYVIWNDLDHNKDLCRDLKENLKLMREEAEKVEVPESLAKGDLPALIRRLVIVSCMPGKNPRVEATTDGFAIFQGKEMVRSFALEDQGERKKAIPQRS